jgi:hypothetical protein
MRPGDRVVAPYTAPGSARSRGPDSPVRRAGRRWPRHSPGPCRDCAAARLAADRGPWVGGGWRPRRSVERGHGSVGAGARRGPRPYVSGATARPTTQLPAPKGQPGQWRLHSPLPRSRARKRVPPRRAAGRCGTGRGASRSLARLGGSLTLHRQCFDGAGQPGDGIALIPYDRGSPRGASGYTVNACRARNSFAPPGRAMLNSRRLCRSSSRVYADSARSPRRRRLTWVAVPIERRARLPSHGTAGRSTRGPGAGSSLRRKWCCLVAPGCDIHK